jgi:hypothetical protein
VNKLIKRFFKKCRNNKTEVILVTTSLLFSFWLMFDNFSYKNGAMLIATKAWSDFASHIPLIRSFSFGNNFPPEYPLFPGSPIRYHFLFYAVVGLLEKSGIRIDIGLNFLSAMGFFALLIMIYLFAKLLFKSKTIGVLSVIFFLFNGSLSFIYFLKNHSFLTGNFLAEIISNKDFSSFAPYYGNGIVSAFWNLNIYTNQRHLALSYALSLFLIYFFVKKIIKKQNISNKTSAILGLILGFSFILNMAVFTMTFFAVFVLLIFFSKNRTQLLIFLFFSALMALPFYLYLQSNNSTHFFVFFPGYLINNNLSFSSFLNYWFYNLGLHLLFIPLGFLIAPKGIKKIFIAFFSLFIVANLFKFSPEIAANHKFINYFMIIGVMFSSCFLVWVWNKKIFLKPLILPVVFFLVFSGIVDFFPIHNDTKIVLADYSINPDVKWVKENTPPNTVFLNTDYLYTASSLAGRKNFLGWPYFSWSQGYDTNKRGEIRNLILTTNNKNLACSLLKQNKIDYIETLPITPSTDNPSMSDMYIKKFIVVYQDKTNGYKIFNVKKSCR